VVGALRGTIKSRYTFGNSPVWECFADLELRRLPESLPGGRTDDDTATLPMRRTGDQAVEHTVITVCGGDVRYFARQEIILFLGRHGGGRRGRIYVLVFQGREDS
jgi:hypothetical protein